MKGTAQTKDFDTSILDKGFNKIEALIGANERIHEASGAMWAIKQLKKAGDKLQAELLYSLFSVEYADVLKQLKDSHATESSS